MHLFLYFPRSSERGDKGKCLAWENPGERGRKNCRGQQRKGTELACRGHGFGFLNHKFMVLDICIYYNYVYLGKPFCFTYVKESKGQLDCAAHTPIPQTLACI
jgi:hypothetical protein